MLSREWLARLTWALDRLTPEDRSILIMRFGVGVSHELSAPEIAQILGISRAAAYRRLQEALARTGRIVQYDVLAVEGPPHERHFVCAALIDGEQLGVGRGTTKKAAEQEAAAEALQALELRRVQG